jgi:hypothetical protein
MLTYPIAFVWVILSVLAMVLAMRSVVRRGMKRTDEMRTRENKSEPQIDTDEH